MIYYCMMIILVIFAIIVSNMISDIIVQFKAEEKLCKILSLNYEWKKIDKNNIEEVINLIDIIAKLELTNRELKLLNLVLHQQSLKGRKLYVEKLMEKCKIYGNI